MRHFPRPGPRGARVGAFCELGPSMFHAAPQPHDEDAGPPHVLAGRRFSPRRLSVLPSTRADCGSPSILCSVPWRTAGWLRLFPEARELPGAESVYVPLSFSSGVARVRFGSPAVTWHPIHGYVAGLPLRDCSSQVVAFDHVVNCAQAYLEPLRGPAAVAVTGVQRRPQGRLGDLIDA